MPIQSHVFTISGVSPTSAAGSGPVGGTGNSGLQEFSRAAIVATIQGATGGTLNLIVQTSFDGKHVGDATKVWYDAGAFAQLANGGAVATFFIEINRASSGVAPVALTQGTLTAGQVLPGMLGDALRLFAVPGAGTTVGALQSLAVEMFTAP